MIAGTIGVMAQETARYSLFGASITNTEQPDYTRTRWMIGLDINYAMNELVREGLPPGEGVGDIGEWLWVLGDDHCWKPDTLMRLLARDVDVIVPLCLLRSPPFQPVAYEAWYDEEAGSRVVLDLEKHPEGGLVPIHSAGTAGMLIRRHVLEDVGEPWFRKYADGQEHISEDLYFCDRVRECGYQIWCDLDVPFGHLTSTIVWPVKQEPGWSFAFGFGKDFVIRMPHGTWVRADMPERQPA